MKTELHRLLPLKIILLLLCVFLVIIFVVIYIDWTPIGTTGIDPASFGLVDIPNAKITYYEVSGSTGDELRRSLDELRPLGYDGSKTDAATRWSIRWNWPGYGSSTCRLSDLTISYQIEVVFPRWIPPAIARRGLVNRWKGYIGALSEHEKGHVDIAIENIPSVDTAIKGATCDTAEAAAQTMISIIRQKDIDFDAATDHGVTQGARFP